MRINHNIASLNTYRMLSANNALSAKSLEKLSSGLRINRAGDDAAGLAISEKMRGQIRGLDQAARNAQDGISLIQTAEGALNETHSILQRMRELAGQSTNGTLTDDDRSKIQGEINQLVDEIDKIAVQTEFNTKKLLNGSIGITATSNNTYADANQKTAVIVRSTTSDTVAGGAFTLTTAGTQTITAAGTFTGGFTNDSITITHTASGKSWTIALQDNDDATAVVERFNAMSNETGVTAFIGDGGAVRLRSIDYGSNSAFTVTGTGTALDKAGIGAVTNGTDAVLGGALVAGGYTADGNTITITGGNAKGLTFEIAGTEENATLTGLSVTTGSVDGDTITINGVSKTLAAGDIGDNAELVSVINTMTRDTGVIAALDGSSVKLTSIGKGDGQTISISTTGTIDIGTGSATITNGTDNIADGSADNGATITVTAGSVDFHVGANKDQTMSLRVSDMRSSALGTGLTANDITNVASFANGISDFKTNSTFLTASLAEDSLKVLDAAISKVSQERANLGAVQNRLEHTINNLGTASENLSAAESRIRDVDMAKEMMEFTKMSILTQAATAMLAQANQQPQSVLQLLGR